MIYSTFKDRFMPCYFVLRFLLACKFEHVLVSHYSIVKTVYFKPFKTCNFFKKGLKMYEMFTVFLKCLHNFSEIELLLFLIICKSKNIPNPGVAKLSCGFPSPCLRSFDKPPSSPLL